MKNKLPLRTNLLLCAVLIAGFISVLAFTYQTYNRAFRNDSERIANLAAESIYQQIDFYSTEPVNGALSMANGDALKGILSRETPEGEPDEAYLEEIQKYLNSYKAQYDFKSIYIASTRTDRYYHFSGAYKTLDPGVPEDAWYFDFIADTERYSFGERKDPYGGTMYFADCKIYGGGGRVLGVVGIGFQIDNLQRLLQSYNAEYNIAMLLVDAESINTMAEAGNNDAFGEFDYLDSALLHSVVEENGIEKATFWGTGEFSNCFVIVRYVPTLRCYLVVESNMSALQEQFARQLVIGVAVTAVIALVVLIIFNTSILSYNKRLLKLVVAQELEYHNLLTAAAKDMYADVYEFDITHGTPAGEDTMRYFKNMGITDVKFADAMAALTEIQIKEGFREEFAAIFSQENILDAFERGIRELDYECMIAPPGEGEKWVRLRARLFYYNSDKSVHMIVFSQDISAEKARETQLLGMAETDPLTGLYNKAATKEHISALLAEAEPGFSGALIITDIDHFKNVNDTLGHAVGDAVIKEFAERLKGQFRDTDICGRIGGDEFIVFLQNIPSRDWLSGKMEELLEALRFEASDPQRPGSETGSCAISASIGVACPAKGMADFDSLYKNADTALYEAKEAGRDRSRIFNASVQTRASIDTLS